ncbi:MAG TPA: hypothetical protein VHP61_04710 [Acidobacteriota bacterium]|nr:hypothetical protein [Acidobacteriota bacterium]
MPRLIESPPLLPVAFEERKILFRLGYRKPAAGVDPEIRNVVREETERARGFVRPRVAAGLLERAELPDHPVFQGAERTALCVCTIGPELEAAAARLMAEGELLRGLVLDWLGSEAVADVSGQADAWLAREGRAAGLWPSKMFSPGIKGWDVSGQEFVFACVPAATIGVGLSASFMMTPRKSFSFRVNYYKDKKLTTRKGL